MDNPKKHAAPDDHDGASNKRPKHFHEGPHAIAQDEKEKQSSVEAAPAHASPVGRLHNDALGAILGFLSIDELHRTLAVSRSWSTFIRSSMPCVGFSVPCTAKWLVLMSSSALARHVTRIEHTDDVRCKLTSDSLFILALTMPQLIVLQCELLPSDACKMILPPKLKSLELDLSALDVAGVNAAVESIGQLTALHQLTLVLSSWQTAVSFAPLCKCATLQVLDVRDPPAVQWTTQPNDAQIDQLRALPGLRWVHIQQLKSSALTKLLRMPHSLQWTTLGGMCDRDGVSAVALLNLPGLLKLSIWDCRDVSFLPALSQLQLLELRIQDEPWAVTADAVVESVSSCHQLTLLDLMAPVTSKHLTLLLPHLTQLESLSLICCSELESLAFLSTAPRSLREFTLDCCTHPALLSGELRHIKPLKQLTTLRFFGSFADLLDGFTQHLLTPPSDLLPLLTVFVNEPAEPAQPAAEAEPEPEAEEADPHMQADPDEPEDE